MAMRKVKISDNAQSVKLKYQGKEGRLAPVDVQFMLGSQDYYAVKIGKVNVLVLRSECESIS